MLAASGCERQQMQREAVASHKRHKRGSDANAGASGNHYCLRRAFCWPWHLPNTKWRSGFDDNELARPRPPPRSVPTSACTVMEGIPAQSAGRGAQRGRLESLVQVQESKLKLKRNLSPGFKENIMKIHFKVIFSLQNGFKHHVFYVTKTHKLYLRINRHSVKIAFKIKLCVSFVFLMFLLKTERKADSSVLKMLHPLLQIGTRFVK